jgi:phage FluMu gp28-like protein
MNDALPTAESPPPASPVDRLLPGTLPSEDLDPLGAGILMAHQAEWLADHSPLKICEKGRRTGVTFAEALDSTLIAAAARSAGGDNTWYIGDTKDKGLEFIAVCARFARHVAAELVAVEEFLFEDKQEDGSSRFIQAYRVRFRSGFQVAALSSNPANIRGLQGRVVIDEAAFHRNVAAVIDACNALLIWGGLIRIISTHNGVLNPFNELIRYAREGRYDYSIHRITFDQAVENGLYERVCLMRGWKSSPEGKTKWYRQIRNAYGPRVDAMREELDVVPREGEGVLLPLVWIEACSSADYVVKRWSPPSETFVDQPEAIRRAEMEAWLEREVGPVLDRLREIDARFSIGEDFAMRQDRSSIAVGYTAQNLHRHVPLIVELQKCPYDQQKQALFWIVFRLRRFQSAVLDANGNGMVLAQEARQKFGQERVMELTASDAWYREHTPLFRAAFEDRTMLIPADRDVRDDLRQIRVIGGVGKVPRDVRTKGTDGGRRHADSAVALLNFYAATLIAPVEFGYTPAALPPRRMDDAPGRDDGGHFGDDRGSDDRGGRGRARFGGGAW